MGHCFGRVHVRPFLYTMIKRNKYGQPLNPYSGQVYYDERDHTTYEWFPYSKTPNDGVWMEIDWNHKRLP